ncbi:MAG TPA: HIRAN domain-containing protein [Solirubrobacteraceae bacterium]|nr:HIRAN domain-containing protein [Solirubrobacteraceae bacterium]
MRIDVTREERYWYPDDGGIVWIAGYMPIDPETRRFLGREALRERGLFVCGVAGAAAHHGEVLQSDDAGPGAELRLRRDPANEHDPNAIAVELARGRAGDQLGWVPRELAAELAPRLDAGDEWTAVVLREQRASPREPRTGATMLLAPAARIELNVR